MPTMKDIFVGRVKDDLLTKKEQARRTFVVLCWILILVVIGILSLSLIGLTVGGEKAPGIAFIGWSYLSALASLLAGGVLGLLFGLPGLAAAKANITSTPSPANAARANTYADSTSLEQVADWLTKIIVGLTLTQFTTWIARLKSLSILLTHDLICRQSASPCGLIPGASIISAFSIAGFLIGYLWMRRYFINELTERDGELDRAYAARLAAAKQDGRVALKPSSGLLAKVITSEEGQSSEYSKTIDAILADGIAKATAGAHASAEAIRPGRDADDPWRGAFGGRPAIDRAVVSATVVDISGNESNFEIAVVVSGLTPADQKDLSSRKALFYLHPTFGREVKQAVFGADGRASLTLYGYGAFTIGVLLEDGSELELNLAEVPGVPLAFKSR